MRVVLILSVLISFSNFAFGATGELIGRCHYQSGTTGANGDFNRGTALANIYRVGRTEEGQPHLVVAHGISLVDGNIRNKKDTLDFGPMKENKPTEVDQGSLWPVYEFEELTIQDTQMKGQWIDHISREMESEGKKNLSGVAGDFRKMGEVVAMTAIKSYIQSYVIRPGTIYPYCIFWERP